MRETKRSVLEKYQRNLEILNYIQVTFGKKCLRIFGLNIWNNLPYHIKSSKNVESFKTFIKNLNGLNCKCVICKKFETIFLFVSHFFYPLQKFLFT